MNKDFLNQIPADEQPVAKKLQSVAENIQVVSPFHAKLESQLREKHAAKMTPARGWQRQILPSLGLAILIIGAVFVLNWVLRTLVPEQLPASNGTPDSSIPFEENVKTGNICQGQLTVMHGYSVFLSNQDKNGFIELDEQKEIGELRSFAWSPDGKQLAIVGNTRGSGNLYLTDSAGSPLRPVLSNSELGYLVGVAWSRDGEQLLTWEIDKNTKLYLMNKDGTGLTEIDLPVQFFETPQFTPDDESILFYGADDSTDGLFQASIDGSQVNLISDRVKSESSFAWSPDGTRLAYIEMTGSDPSEASLVIGNGSNEPATVTIPFPVEVSFSNHEPANLSWSLDGNSLVFEFRNTSVAVVIPENPDGSWVLSDSAHAPAISSDGGCLAYIRNRQVFLSELASAESSSTNPAPVLLADLPAGRGTANTQLDKLQWIPGTISVPDIQDQVELVPTPSGTEYDWRGMKLYVDSALPPAPAQVGLYEAQADRHATLDAARALAQQFGMNGQIYETPPELGGSDTTDFLVVDGSQHLRVRSNLYFSYYPDYPRWTSHSTSVQMIEQATAENLIENFLRTHGFAFDYKIEASGFHDGYYALPLTSEGLTIHHNHFSAAGFLFRFDQNEILAVEASLVTYSLVDNFEVISAEEALQKLLNPNITAGLVEGGHSVSEPIQAWYRPRPENQTITVWGWINSFKSAEGGAPLVTFDGYQATGNLAGLAESTPNTFVEATGQFQTMDGNKIFNVESWQVFDGHEDGPVGTIQRDGDQVILTTPDDRKLILPDIPADMPLPMENAFVLGVAQGNVFEWKLVDTRMQGGGGGGGGGGGSGFYKPNLTGTPVPLPTAQVQQETNTGTGEYVVEEGDTLSAIAEAFGTTVDELMQANGLNESTIFIGQTLIVPGAQEEQSLIGQKLDSQRGTLTVTIINKSDGSQTVDYRLQVEDRESRYQLMRLEGNGLDELQTRNNLPIDIWGTIERYDTDLGKSIPVVNVERFEIPYPDLGYQIYKGTQSLTTVQGETITLFTTEDGQTYAQANGYGGLVGNEGDQLLMEALLLPDETIAGYPVLQAISISMAINPKSGEPVEMEATANQPYVVNEADYPQQEIPAELTATIESVELVYFTPNQRYSVPDPTARPVYLQPAWLFQGHYWDGSAFEILVQALKDEYLLPEVDTIEPPG